ncbi:hypothetical protein WHZ78_17590 [Bradyrhizobium symbiodeficiens]|uniref:hypothetical protein n=1 Tax=Bradyrhizobium symbiodeficiens TaxID=1404367 RepID=UPI0030CCD47D
MDGIKVDLFEDYINGAQREAKLRFGRELSADELAEKFAGHGLNARVEHLKTLKADAELTIDEAAKRYVYEGALRGMHEAMRKAGR